MKSSVFGLVGFVCCAMGSVTLATAQESPTGTVACGVSGDELIMTDCISCTVKYLASDGSETSGPTLKRSEIPKGILIMDGGEDGVDLLYAASDSTISVVVALNIRQPLARILMHEKTRQGKSEIDFVAELLDYDQFVLMLPLDGTEEYRQALMVCRIKSPR